MKPSLLIGMVVLAAAVAWFCLRNPDLAPVQAPAGRDEPSKVPVAAADPTRTPGTRPGPGNPPAEDVDAWFLRQPDEVRASVLMGLGADYGGKGSLTAYLMDLERRIAAGDTPAAIPAAELLRTCSLAVEGAAATPDPAHPGTLVLSACRTLPAREPGHESRIIAAAARKGLPEAVRREWGYMPRDIAESRDTAARREWANGVAGRLEALANQGDYEAQLVLGRAYLTNDFGMQHARAAEQYGAFLRTAPLSDPRREAIQRFIARLCLAGQLSDPSYCG